MHENLTPTRRNIFKTLRKMKTAHPDFVKGVSTFEGKVYAYTPNEGSQPNARDKRHLVNNSETLNKFYREFVKKPLELFLENIRH